MSNEKLPPGVEIHGKSLRISFSHNHQRCRETLNLRPTKQNIKFAAGKLAAIKHEIAIGSFNYADHFPNSPRAKGNRCNLRLSDLAAEYLSLKEADIRGTTLYRYKSTMKSCLNLYGESRTSSTLTKASVMAWRSKIIMGKTARTANAYLSVIGNFLNFLFDYEYISEKLSEQLKAVKQPELDPDPFSHEEIARAIEHCRFKQHANIITLMVYSGLRVGELCGIAWEDIDLEAGTMKVSRAVTFQRGLKTPKTDKSRTIFLLPPALEALKSQMQFSYMMPAEHYDVELSDKTHITETLRFVFLSSVTLPGSENTFLSRTSVTKVWKSISQRAGIRYRRVYQLRHTYASWMLTSGVNPAFIASQMGHANFQMLARVYGKWMPDHSRSESEKAWQALKQNAPILPQEYSGEN
ncbi:site-specific integrase [Photobacterium sp. 1_MG-2023]|uniref:site-specific integrase n=1 Tax=Photobacterium sp. 1_MG-2023 TaxID=3062646 RepID=UPI0026E31280|nr:site-specific integrase [Photobacterium sp. 1_MG-2023]MDO6706746.1 site-specific integrase [Photobacterium sp. 1_MG-2023]